MRDAIFERAGRQVLGLPALDQHIYVPALERDRAHLSESRLAQLATREHQRSLSVRLRCVTAVAVATTQRAQRVCQIIHRKLLSSPVVCTLSQNRSVFVPTRSESEIPPKGTRARCSGHPLPQLRRPRCSLWGGRAGVVARDEES